MAVCVGRGAVAVRAVKAPRAFTARAPASQAGLRAAPVLPQRSGFSAALVGVGLRVSSAPRTLVNKLAGLLVEANGKRCMGATGGGTRRKKARVSGFRTRRTTTAGRATLKRRRDKGRKVLCPAGNPRMWNRAKRPGM